MATKKTTSKKAPTPQAKSIYVPPLSEKRIRVWVIGKTPLILHAWGSATHHSSSRDDMLKKQMGLPTRKKAPKDPQACIDACFYFTADGHYGFPAAAFKHAAVGACRFVDAKMTEARGMFFVTGDPDVDMIQIYGADPVPREDMVRLQGKTADIRFRPMFTEWACPLDLEYDASVTSPEQLANLINRAGMGVGVGEWRPEKNGDFGRFRVATSKTEITKYQKRIPKVGAIKITLADLFPGEEFADAAE
jgi:hypothetical protein